jgi:uncharacterized repeat protein (TIGR03803 family)
MRRNGFWIAILALLLLLPVLSFGSPPASKERVIYSFQGGADGANPQSDLILDSAGNLYGTASAGGGTGCNTVGCGIVFELKRTEDGWQEQVLYRFAGGSDGSTPLAGLIFDAAGNLYGTTVTGGNSEYPSGTVFKLAPDSKGGWTESIIYSFGSNGNAGFNPRSDLAFDAQGNLYGTTPDDALGRCSIFSYGCGAVFELTPLQNGTWKETIIHQFTGPPDGALPSSGLILDSTGNLYGMTQYGGTGRCANNAYKGCGTIYKLTPDSHGGRTETITYNFAFGGGFGIFPAGELILDEAGCLFALAQAGGDQYGTVFQLRDSQKFGWQQGVLHRFFGAPLDGQLPAGRLVRTTDGNLFGVASNGGANRFGLVFELEHSEGDKEQILHSFAGPPDGANPSAGLVRDSQGHLYGTTRYGGSATACTGGCGTVYEVVP